jgi:hypothetical protein
MTDHNDKRASERISVVCSKYFKAQLIEESARRDMTITELIKVAVREYYRLHPHNPNWLDRNKQN